DHAAHGILSGGRLAPARIASGRARRRNEMGKSEHRRRAVFLDRDGVLNEVVMRGQTPSPTAGLGDLVLTANAADACARLRGAGFLLVVVTNQPDVARGSQTREMVDAINAKVQEFLELDDVRVCFHDDADRCACRKPAPGMLLTAA